MIACASAAAIAAFKTLFQFACMKYIGVFKQMTVRVDNMVALLFLMNTRHIPYWHICHNQARISQMPRAVDRCWPGSGTLRNVSKISDIPGETFQHKDYRAWPSDLCNGNPYAWKDRLYTEMVPMAVSQQTYNTAYMQHPYSAHSMWRKCGQQRKTSHWVQLGQIDATLDHVQIGRLSRSNLVPLCFTARYSWTCTLRTEAY